MIKDFGDFYSHNSKMKWIISVLVIISIVFSIGYVNIIINDIKEREKNTIELYASSIEYLANYENDINTDFLIQEIVIRNKSIPVIITDKNDKIIDSKNIKLKNDYSLIEKEKLLIKELSLMKGINDPIKIYLKNEKNKIIDYQFIYYKNSELLNILSFFPYIQIFVIVILSIIFYLIFSYSNKAEKNKIWVGLAKETAHQLGTPLSSLIGWVEYIKSKKILKSKPEIILEIEKDIKRFTVITERFSNIGSKPKLEYVELIKLINKSIDYLKKRSSSKIIFLIESSIKNVKVKINKELLGWAIENICKNSIDAVGEKGTIKIIINSKKNELLIDITDNGKGIEKNQFINIFNPGISSKKRGWGLGLSLTKRIIEEYHNGKIFVLKSIKGIETTLRIILPKI
tara:strand:- start:1617 stop:2819 length:1203 start_codon:yes stop_codon:yes gene_type:complete